MLLVGARSHHRRQDVYHGEMSPTRESVAATNPHRAARRRVAESTSRVGRGRGAGVSLALSAAGVRRAVSLQTAKRSWQRGTTDRYPPRPTHPLDVHQNSSHPPRSPRAAAPRHRSVSWVVLVGVPAGYAAVGTRQGLGFTLDGLSAGGRGSDMAPHPRLCVIVSGKWSWNCWGWGSSRYEPHLLSFAPAATAGDSCSRCGRGCLMLYLNPVAAMLIGAGAALSFALTTAVKLWRAGRRRSDPS